MSFKLTADRNGRQVKCRITDASGRTSWTNIATATISQTPIRITKQPTNQKSAVNGTVTFETAATGNGIKYLWYVKDKSDDDFRATSNTTASLSFKLTTDRNGRQVKCLITDASGKTAWTNAATATIATLKITAQPQNQEAKRDENVSFSVSASGSDLSYLWYVKDKSDDDFRATSNTTTSISFKLTTERNGRQVKCLVSDPYGNEVFTRVATAVIQAVNSIVITEQPVSQTVAKDKTVSFEVGATGDGLSFRWYCKDPGDSAFRETSVTDTTLSFKLTEERDGRQVKCLIKDAGGFKAWTNVATATIAPNTIRISQHPSSTTAEVGDTVSFSVSATGSSLTYQWEELLPNSTSWRNTSLSGSKTNNLCFTAKAEHNGRTFRCVVSDTYGYSKTSNEAKLTVNDVQTITVGNFSIYIGTGEAFATLRFVPTRSGRYTLTSTGSDDTQAYLYTVSGTLLAYNDDGGENTNFLISHDLTAGNTYYFEVGYYSSSMTGTINLTLSSESSVQITQQPSSVSVAAGSQASFSVTASGEGTLSYKWQEKTYGSSSWQDMSGSTSSTLSFFTTPWQNGNGYRCVVTDSGATATSNQANLTVTTPTIYTGSTTASINTAGASAWYKFTPSKTGRYTLTSTGSADTKCYLYSSSGSQLAYNDDGGENTNFLISYSLTAGYTYYYQVRFYSSTATGSISLVMSADSTPTTTRYRALLIGNEDYADGTLPGCINDATAMNRMLSGLSNSFSCTQRNSQTAAQIKSAISTAFSGATNNDVSLFYYSGHGMGSDSSSILGALVGINYSNNYNDYLTTSALASELSKVPGRVIVILDSCHSGAAINKGIEDPEASAEAFNQSVIDAFAAYDSTVYVNNEKVGELATSKFIVITACRKDQTSSSFTYTSGSNSGKSFGAFTKCFVEGCGVQYFTGSYTGSMPADSNSNNQLTVYEIYTYAQTEASALNSGQTAQYYASNSSEVLFRR